INRLTSLALNLSNVASRCRTVWIYPFYLPRPSPPPPAAVCSPCRRCSTNPRYIQPDYLRTSPSALVPPTQSTPATCTTKAIVAATYPPCPATASTPPALQSSAYLTSPARPPTPTPTSSASRAPPALPAHQARPLVIPTVPPPAPRPVLLCPTARSPSRSRPHTHT
ncbi:hypothetical protein DFH09DRAFT_1186643, partial [Mycena vulgaris]